MKIPLLCALLALTPLAALAQSAPKTFEPGPTFISLGGSVAQSNTSEFGGASLNAFSGWESSETVLFGRFSTYGSTAYRTIRYQHAAGNVGTIGGSGSTIVPAFEVRGSELESSGGIGVLPHVYAVGSTLRIASNVGYPPLSGIGYGIAFTPPANHGPLPYGQVTYYPNVGGNYTLASGYQTALTYRALRVQAGVLVPIYSNRLFLDAGYVTTALNNRTNAPAPVRLSAFTLGVAYRIP